MLSNSQMDHGQDKAKDGNHRPGPETVTRAAGAAAIAEGRRGMESQNGESKNRGRKMGASAAMSMGGAGGTAGSTGISSKTGPPTHDEIAARAFQVYCRKGRPEGRDAENWLEAEAELMRERGMTGRKKG